MGVWVGSIRRAVCEHRLLATKLPLPDGQKMLGAEGDEFVLSQHPRERIAPQAIRLRRSRHLLLLQESDESAQFRHGLLIGGLELGGQRLLFDFLERRHEIFLQECDRTFGHLDGGLDVRLGQSLGQVRTARRP